MAHSSLIGQIIFEPRLNVNLPGLVWEEPRHRYDWWSPGHLKSGPWSRMGLKSLRNKVVAANCKISFSPSDVPSLPPAPSLHLIVITCCEWLKLEAVRMGYSRSPYSNLPWFVSWDLPHLWFWAGFLPSPKDQADPVHKGTKGLV